MSDPRGTLRTEFCRKLELRVGKKLEHEKGSCPRETDGERDAGTHLTPQFFLRALDWFIFFLRPADTISPSGTLKRP